MSKVCQLFSGSSGNSIFISSKGCKVLVDIGVSAKRCENALRNIGVEPADIDAVFVTHEHNDHSSGVRVFSSRYNIPVFASEICLEEMLNTGVLNSKNDARVIQHGAQVGSIEAVTFHQSHDSVDCLGYRFNLPDGRAVSVCTDTGYITEDAKAKLEKTDLIFIESNHEVSMVNTGPYPYHLKKRILGMQGHLSNFACGEYIKELAQSGTTRFVLSHLSRENNMPDIARQTALAAMAEIGMRENIDFRLYVSPPENESGAIVL
ncbi:MAG: MBL fold metallo-hydrolase [Eubacterium sp.]